MYGQIHMQQRGLVFQNRTLFALNQTLTINMTRL